MPTPPNIDVFIDRLKRASLLVFGAGYDDQPHLTRVLRQLIGHTPAELARGGMFLDL